MTSAAGPRSSFSGNRTRKNRNRWRLDFKACGKLAGQETVYFFSMLGKITALGRTGKERKTGEVLGGKPDGG
jgi:hypothetical protein